MKQQTFVAA